LRRTRQQVRDHAKRRKHSFEEESLLRHDMLHLHKRKQRSDKDKRNNERADAWPHEPGGQMEQPTQSDREAGLKDNEPEHRMLQVRNMECR
jgi:hypothetical protein